MFACPDLTKKSEAINDAKVIKISQIANVYVTFFI